jgi:hypothetical protein
MTKQRLIMGLGALVGAAALASTARAQPAQIYLNGRPLETSVQPMNRNGRLLVPLRDIFEALGARVRYNDATQEIRARRDDTRVEMRLGSRRAEVNDRVVLLDVPARSYYGHTMVPLRFVSEALGANVRYNAEEYRVSIFDRRGHEEFYGHDRRDGDMRPEHRRDDFDRRDHR